jgi:hypothetical protein
MDSLGIVGTALVDLLGKIDLGGQGVGALMALLSAVVFRAVQIVLQKLPTKWRWVDNRLTLGIVNRVLASIFGKTTMIYNGKIDTAHKEDLRKEAMKHLSRNGGILQEFEKAVKS